MRDHGGSFVVIPQELLQHPCRGRRRLSSVSRGSGVVAHRTALRLARHSAAAVRVARHEVVPTHAALNPGAPDVI
jgi:hypothetical protein